MQKLGSFFAAIMLSLVIGSCSEEKSVDKPPVNVPGPVTAAESKLVAAGNEFTWSLLREVVESETSQPNKNIFISPLSASMALGVPYNGQRNTPQTAKQPAVGFGSLSAQQINIA